MEGCRKVKSEGVGNPWFPKDLGVFDYVSNQGGKPGLDGIGLPYLNLQGLSLSPPFGATCYLISVLGRREIQGREVSWHNLAKVLLSVWLVFYFSRGLGSPGRVEVPFDAQDLGGIFSDGQYKGWPIVALAGA